MQWRWPRPHNAITREIIRNTPDLLPFPEEEDRVVWTLTHDGKYSSKSVWEALRPVGEEVPWHSLVWFRYHFPRWALIQWMAFHGRLATRDGLNSWGKRDNDNCVSCGVRWNPMISSFSAAPFLLRFGPLSLPNVAFTDLLWLRRMKYLGVLTFAIRNLWIAHL